MKTRNRLIHTVIPSLTLAVLTLIGSETIYAQQDKTKKQSQTQIEQKKAQTNVAQIGQQAGVMSKEDVNKMIQNWPSESREAANKTIAKYGQPAEATQNMLTWNDNGPWKKTMVYKEAIDHNFPMKHKDVLEQVIDYKVPSELFSQIAMYDGSVMVKRTIGEISARCDKEEANMLALNLANDIITGKKNVDEAREFYTQTITSFGNGEKPEYTQKLTFAIAKGGTADPDESTIDLMDKMKNMIKGSGSE